VKPFLIQTIGGRVKSDFCFGLVEAIEFQEWVGNSMPYRLSAEPNVQGMVPVGTLEFVLEYMRQYYGVTPKPQNVPIELQPFAGRKFYQKGDTMPPLVFAKDAEHFKTITGVYVSDKLPADNLQISDVVEIESEWRGFVFRGKLVGLQNYGGDFTCFPNIEPIQSMIAAFNSAPVAYTLDVGVNGDGTFAIEVHDFFSCGLYGFADKGILPMMFSQWWHEWEKKVFTDKAKAPIPEGLVTTPTHGRRAENAIPARMGGVKE
jgi:hypothetical protein